MTRDEIIDYASRYMDANEIVQFPQEGEAFAFFVRELPLDKILDADEGWKFAGYNMCTGYVLDDESKPAGKWIWINYISLLMFPPRSSAFKLQPPHVCRGRWQNPDRTHEYRMVVLDLADQYGGFSQEPDPKLPKATIDPAPGETPSNILPFPGKKRAK